MTHKQGPQTHRSNVGQTTLQFLKEMLPSQLSSAGLLRIYGSPFPDTTTLCVE